MRRFIEEDENGYITTHVVSKNYDYYFEQTGLDPDSPKVVEFVEDSDIPECDTVAKIEISNKQMTVDTNWERKLMPPNCIQRKHRVRLKNKLDAELEKQNPDPVICVKLKHDIDTCKNWTEKKWYEQAKKNLQEDVHNKPDVMAKLDAKIAELP